MSPKQLAAIHEKDHAQGHAPLPGHEMLTMHDQMRAMNIPAAKVTSPVNGGVLNRRREFLKGRIQYHAENGHAANQDFSGSNFAGKPSTAGGSDY